MGNIMHTPFLPLHPGQSNASSSICFSVLPSFGLGFVFSAHKLLVSRGVTARRLVALLVDTSKWWEGREVRTSCGSHGLPNWSTASAVEVLSCLLHGVLHARLLPALILMAIRRLVS